MSQAPSATTAATTDATALDLLREPLTLRSGLELPNRLVKAAMTESLADRDGDPTDLHVRLYERWAASGLGAMITGNCMVDRRYLERARNVVVDDLTDEGALRRYAAACQDVPTVVQLNHPGRQTNRAVAWQPVSASAGGAVEVLGLFGRPRALSTAEVEDVRDRFVDAAHRVVRAGFRGVQVHAAHGYLLSQFLSAATNQRDDRYGGDLAGRARLLLEVTQACREQLDDHVSVWVKVNSNDFRDGGIDEDEAAQVVRWLDEAGADVVEVSGGTYESLKFLDDEPTDRAAYFLDFARAVQSEVEVPIMLTGGFHEVTGMAEARRDGIELLGLARPLAADPDLATRLLDGTTDRAARPAPSLPESLPGGLAETSRVGWYRLRMELAARDLRPWSPPAPVAAADYALREVVTALADLPRRRRRVRAR